MKEMIKTILAICFALLFIGFVYPEYIFTDDVIVVVDENGNQIGSFWSLPGSVDEKIAQLEQDFQNQNPDVEIAWRWMPFLNAQEQNPN